MVPEDLMRHVVWLVIYIALIGCLAAIPEDRALAIISQNPTPKEIKIDSAKFDEFVGQYTLVDIPDLVLSFFREGDKFYVQPTNQERIEIFAASETQFFLKAPEADTTFMRDPQGKVIGLLWRQNNRELRANKTSNQPAIQNNIAFERREEMIAMRDGKRLHTLIFTPRTQSEDLPFLMNRTPYGIGGASDSINRRYRDFIPDGYIFVLQDI